MQSSTNAVFSFNTCTDGHGISVGSTGGATVSSDDTVNGLIVSNNQTIDSVNGLHIKTIVGEKGLVTDVTYTDNTLSNVQNAIVVHSDYDKATGGYATHPTSAVGIADVTIDGLSGSATLLYDVLANPSVVSNWKFSGITASGAHGSCKGQPSTVAC
ncbi:hypothetical protein Gpo141_00014858 [Globisporangium polare]